MENSKLRVLIIDDDNIILFALSNVFIQKGYEVLQASNGREGFNVYMQNKDKIDVILSDINMPELDGMELLEEIRRNGDDIPVIIMTGQGDLQTSIKALKLGAFDFIIKPFELHEIYSTFSKLESILASKKSLMDKILPSVTGNIEFSIPSHINLISDSVSFVHNILYPFWQLHKIDHHKVSLCLHEALTNAVIHGNLEISSAIKEQSIEDYYQILKEREADENYAKREVMIRYHWTTEQFVFDIKDEGGGFDYENLPDLNDPMSLLSSGRGLVLIRSFMDEINWTGNGNQMSMRKFLTGLNNAESALDSTKG